MTGSLNPGLPTAGHAGTDERIAPTQQSLRRTLAWIFSASHIVCRTAPASRPSCR
jgi:hypothetical protein